MTDEEKKQNNPEKDREKEGRYRPEEVRGLLRAVADEAPEIIKRLMESVYSEEAGRNIGRSVGGLYEELVEAGIDEEEALESAKDYLSPLKKISQGGNLNLDKEGLKKLNCDEEVEEN